MKQSLAINTINLPVRLFGVLFYYSPESISFKSLSTILSEIESLFCWSDEMLITEQRNIMLANLDDVELPYQFSVLFEGQGSMPAPPWGSVYLDKENLLMGESTERYRLFLTENNMVIQTGINEPEDQFGLMLMTLALLIESEQFNAGKTLISDHLMPWASRYLTLLAENEISPFYRALAVITEQFLSSLIMKLDLTISNYCLYR